METNKKGIKEWAREFFAVDHVAHLGVCYIITTFIAAVLVKYPIWAIISGVVVSLGTGVGKEIYDKKRGGKFDLTDLWFDCVGILFGLITIAIFFIYIDRNII